MTLPTYGAVALACWIAGFPAKAQTTVHLSVSQPRPLEAAINQLEKKIGLPLNYEDPRYECAADIQDVTDLVQNAKQRAAHPNTRILVPKAGALVFDATLPAIPQPADALSALTQLRLLYESNGYAGRFSVTTIGSVLTIQPKSARSSDCTWREVSPAMDTRITFKPEARDATAALSLILSTLTRQLRVKVGLANLPMLAFAKKITTLGASDEPASVVLVRLFEQLSTPGPTSNYSYHLFFDPGVKYYLLDISAVAPVRSETNTPAIPAPTPGFTPGVAPKK